MPDIYIFDSGSSVRQLKDICFRWLMEKNYESEIVCGEWQNLCLPDSVCLYMIGGGDSLRDISDAIRKKNPESYIVVLISGMSELAAAVRPSICPSGYIMKPPKTDAVEELLEEIFSDYARSFGGSRRMFHFKLKSKEFALPYDSIILFESRSKKVIVRTEIQEFEYYDTMDNILKSVPEEFVRIHKSFIVNTSRIAAADFGAMSVTFDDGSEAYISRTYKNDLKDKLGKGRDVE